MKFRAIRPMILTAVLAASMQQCALVNNPAAPVYEILNDAVCVVSLSTPATTFTEGNMGTIVPDRAQTNRNLMEFNSSDIIIRTYNKDVYVLERYGFDNIIKIPNSSLPASISRTNCSYWKNLGTGVNIQDIAFASVSKAYITEYATPFVLVVNPVNGFKLDSIDLSEISFSPDTLAVSHMSPAVIADSKLYVGCQRLTPQYEPVDTSLVIVISTSTDSVLKAIRLKYRNPVAMTTFGTRVFVTSPGVYADATDGGLEVIEATKDSTGVLVTDAQVGGSINDVVIVNDSIGYISVYKVNSKSEYWTEILPFNPGTGQVGMKIAGIENGFGGMVVSSKYLYVGDRSESNPGVYAIDFYADTIVAGPYKVGMPPYGLVVVPR